MDAAKQFVAQFTSKRGHKTSVEEVVRPAVTYETIKPTRHEIITTATDKEVHQHHYHTTIQPLSHKEVLPTKHTLNVVPVVHNDHSHKTRDASAKVEAAFKKELALFTNTTVTEPVRHTRAELPQVVGEHVHHHVHETVQPIIFKETVTPQVVHTTIPVHEVHYSEAIHHKMSELPVVMMEHFLKTRKIDEQTIARENYDGAPRPYNSKLVIDPTKFHFGPRTSTTTTTTTTTTTSSSPKRNTMSTPPLSPVSAAGSSPEMPSTPKDHHFGQTGVRTSEDSMHDFHLSSSPTAKKTTDARPLQAPQRVLF